MPLALTALIGLVVYRCGRWAGADLGARRRRPHRRPGRHRLLRHLRRRRRGHLRAGRPGRPRARAWAAPCVGVAAGLRGRRHPRARRRHRPARGLGRPGARLGPVDRVRRAARRSCSSSPPRRVLVAVMLVLGLNDAADDDVRPAPRRRATTCLRRSRRVSVAPNAVLLGGAYLLGPGFAVGTGTIVSPQRGRARAGAGVPAARRPARRGRRPRSGRWAAWRSRWSSAAVGAVLAQRAYGVTAYDSAALRGFGTGFGAALLTTLAIALAGGPMGTGRMADIGAPVGEVLVAAVAAMSLGGLVGRAGDGLVAATSAAAPPLQTTDRRSVTCAGAPRPSRRPRLRRRHQPPGPARRGRRTRRTAPRSSPSAPTGTASRGWPAPRGPACRPSCTRCADFDHPRGVGRRADRDRGRASSPTWSCWPAS